MKCDCCGNTYTFGNRPDGTPNGVGMVIAKGKYIHVCADCVIALGKGDKTVSDWVQRMKRGNDLMDVKDALEIVEHASRIQCSKCWKHGECGSCGIRKAYSVTIEALEKRTPKKPRDGYYCPVCDWTINGNGHRMHFCPSCGQAIDWEG